MFRRTGKQSIISFSNTMKHSLCKIYNIKIFIAVSAMQLQG